LGSSENPAAETTSSAPIRVSVTVPPTASRRIPVISAPTGISPTDSVRAVAPTRPSRTSGESIVRRVMYATSTLVLRMPANRDTATMTGTGAPAAMTSEAPMPMAPRIMTRPTGLKA
jgi:hypothetical protein